MEINFSLHHQLNTVFPQLNSLSMVIITNPPWLHGDIVVTVITMIMSLTTFSVLCHVWFFSPSSKSCYWSYDAVLFLNCQKVPSSLAKPIMGQCWALLFEMFWIKNYYALCANHLGVYSIIYDTIGELSWLHILKNLVAFCSCFMYCQKFCDLTQWGKTACFAGCY